MPGSKLLWIFLFSCTVLFSQEQRDTNISGRVTHLGEAVSDVHVMNLSAEKATITNEDGLFNLPARAGDTLMFSAVQFRRQSLVISIAMLQSKGILVPLEEFVNELDEVIVRPFNLSGDIGRDLQQMPGDGVVVASTLGLPNAYVKPLTQAERKLYEATSGMGLVPLNPILNAITGRTRYLKKILAIERKYERTNRVREFYSDTLFISDLKIPASRIEDFMYFCEVDSLFQGMVDTADQLKIWEYLKSKSVEYRKNNILE